MPQNWNGEGAATVDAAGICSFQSGRWALPPTRTQRGGDSLIWEGSSGAWGPNSVWISILLIWAGGVCRDRLSHSFSWLNSIPERGLGSFNHSLSDALLHYLCFLSHCSVAHWTYLHIYLYTNVACLLDRFLEMEECKRILLIIFQVNIISDTGIPCFLALQFIALHRCCSF